MYDIIIIGAGAAGMTAALYALRNGKKVLLLESETLGGQIATSPRLENYPSVKEISGEQFADNLYEQISALGAELEIEKVVDLSKTGNVFTVKTEYGSYEAKAVIVATGVKYRHIKTRSDSERLTGRGVYYCALCDGPFFKGKEVAVIGSGNSALKYASLLAEYCSKVYIYTRRDTFSGFDNFSQIVLSKPNVEWRPNTSIVDFVGDKELTAIKYIDASGSEQTHEITGAFVAIGHVPDNKAFAGLARLDEEGYIVAGEDCKTSTDGLFVAGDCRTKAVRQVTTACSDGSIAATNACYYLDSYFSLGKEK